MSGTNMDGRYLPDVVMPEDVHARCVLAMTLLAIAALQDGKVKNTPWGSSYKKATEILHGVSLTVSLHVMRDRLAPSWGEWSIKLSILLSTYSIK